VEAGPPKDADGGSFTDGKLVEGGGGQKGKCMKEIRKKKRGPKNSYERPGVKPPELLTHASESSDAQDETVTEKKKPKCGARTRKFGDHCATPQGNAAVHCREEYIKTGYWATLHKKSVNGEKDVPG